MAANTSRRQREKDTQKRVESALKYYRRKESWTADRLREKIGRLAIRMLAANQVFHEQAGESLLAESMKQSLHRVIQLHRPPPGPTG